MKRSIITYLLCLICFGAFAQSKIGYVQLDSIVKKTPDYTNALTKVDCANDSLQNIMARKQKAFDNWLNQGGCHGKKLSPEEMLKKQFTLDSLQDSLYTLGYRYRDYLYNLHWALVDPIIEKVKKAIVDIAKEHGYTYVLDSSNSNAYTLKDGDNDITPLIIERLTKQ